MIINDNDLPEIDFGTKFLVEERAIQRYGDNSCIFEGFDTAELIIVKEENGKMIIQEKERNIGVQEYFNPNFMIGYAENDVFKIMCTITYDKKTIKKAKELAEEQFNDL